MIGKNIKQFRNEKNMTQDQLAEKLSVTRQAVSNWENGKTQPDVETLGNIAQVLEVTLEDLIHDEPKKKVHVAVEKGSAGGVTLGAVLAVVISYVKWGSIPWAILHGVLGWIYVIYYAIKY